MDSEEYIQILNQFHPTREEHKIAYKEIGSDDVQAEEDYPKLFYRLVDRYPKLDYGYAELNSLLNETNILELGIDSVHFYSEIEGDGDYHIFGSLDSNHLLAIYSLNGEVVGLNDEDYSIYYYSESLQSFLEFIPNLTKFCTQRFNRGVKPSEEDVCAMIDILGGEKYEEFARDILLRFTGDYE